jgi:acyl-CoA thioesterase II
VEAAAWGQWWRRSQGLEARSERVGETVRVSKYHCFADLAVGDHWEDVSLSSTDSDRPGGLLGLLDLDEAGPDLFVAPTPAEGPPRLFGGQVASQSLRAATLTIDEGRQVHSMHSYFIRPGRPNTPLHLEVERIRDGRSFATRRVTARQEDGAIFVLDASFHVVEQGFDWQVPSPSLEPGPESLTAGDGPMGMPMRSSGSRPAWVDEAIKAREAAGDAPGEPTAAEMGRMRRMRGGPFGGLFDMRPLRMSEDFRPHPAWITLREPIGDDPALHACALTFISDMAVVRSARAPGSTDGGWGGASLDHAVWFHRPFRVDEWLLFSAEPVSNYGARGLARGSFHTEDGVLVASFVQECLLRSTGSPPPP